MRNEFAMILLALIWNKAGKTFCNSSEGDEKSAARHLLVQEMCFEKRLREHLVMKEKGLRKVWRYLLI